MNQPDLLGVTGAVHDEASSGGRPGTFLGGGGDSCATGDGFEPAGEGHTWVRPSMVPSFGGVRSYSSERLLGCQLFALCFKVRAVISKWFFLIPISVGSDDA